MCQISSNLVDIYLILDYLQFKKIIYLLCVYFFIYFYSIFI